MTERMQPTDGTIRVGDFVVDPRSGELRNGAGRQVLSAQPLHVLLALIERPGDLVTRDELRTRLWPSDTFVDFEHGLNAVIKRLRDALGDSADTPRYIETVPRRGYRLVAAVRASDQPAADPGSPATADPATRPTPWRRVAFAAVAIAIGMLSIAGLRRALRPAEPAASARQAETVAVPVRLTFGAGFQTDVAFSPDGRRVAFAWDRDGNFDLFTQSVDGGEPVRITSSPANETQPAWSPDGQRIVFRSDADGGALLTVGLDGGTVRRVASFGFNPAWMPDGRDIAFSTARPSEVKKLYLVMADGGEPPREILTEATHTGIWLSFAVHPDGRIGLFGAHGGTRWGFYVSDPGRRRLSTVAGRAPMDPKFEEAFRRVRRVFWSPRGDAVLMESLVAGAWTVWRTPIDPVTQAGGVPQRLTGSLGDTVGSAVSPDGRTIAFTSITGGTRPWVFPFDADRGTPPGEGRPVTDEDASVRQFSMSADGRAIFYRELRRGRAQDRAVRLSLDTGERTVLADDVRSVPVPGSSGSETVYLRRRRPEGGSHAEYVYALTWRTAAGQERLLTSWGTDWIGPSDVRRDDAVVLATRCPSPCTGPAALTEWPVGPASVTEPARVLLEAKTKSFWQGRYSPDGRWVSFVVRDLALNGLEMGIVPAGASRASTWNRVAADHRWPDKPIWSPDGRTLYFLSLTASGIFELWGVRIDPDRGTQSGDPFLVKRFDSPGWHIDTNTEYLEMDITRGRLVLPMRTVRGSIWMVSTPGS